MALAIETSVEHDIQNHQRIVCVGIDGANQKLTCGKLSSDVLNTKLSALRRGKI